MKLRLHLLTLSKMPRWFRRIFEPYWLGYEDGLKDGVEMSKSIYDHVREFEIDEQDS